MLPWQLPWQKYYASEVCNEIAAKTVQIHGGYGFIKDYKIERMFRDCRVFTIYEGTSQVQQMVIFLVNYWNMNIEEQTTMKILVCVKQVPDTNRSKRSIRLREP